MERYSAVSRVLLRVFFLNIAVAAAKIALGYSTGAISILSDGFHSLTDTASNVVALENAPGFAIPPRCREKSTQGGSGCSLKAKSKSNEASKKEVIPLRPLSGGWPSSAAATKRDLLEQQWAFKHSTLLGPNVGRAMQQAGAFEVWIKGASLFHDYSASCRTA